MLSHSPLNTAASPGPARLPIHQAQNNSRNQMHSPSPQMQNGNYGMPPMNNFNNQMPPIGMRGGPQQQQHMHPDDIMGGFGGNYGPPGNGGMPPHMNGNQMGGPQNPYSPMSNGPNGPNNGMMNMNPHANMMSPHGGQPGNIMPMFNQQGQPQGPQGHGHPASGINNYLKEMFKIIEFIRIFFK